jgi:glycosyltransferase involved in cell wall biosynthesis
VRNGPDLARFINVNPDPALRARGQAILGYVGDMGQHDGLDYLLRSLHYLRYTLGRTDFYAVLIGRGNAWDSLQKLAQQLQLTKYVWFTGWVSSEDVLRYLASADICLDPDPYNSFTDRSSMIKMSEYMALGKPIVAFDLTEHRATAQGAAVYAQRNDEADFARQIATLIDDPERRQAMGQLGRQRVEQALSWHYSIPPLLAAYEQLVGHSVTKPTQKWAWPRFFSE